MSNLLEKVVCEYNMYARTINTMSNIMDAALLLHSTTIAAFMDISVETLHEDFDEVLLDIDDDLQRSLTCQLVGISVITEMSEYIRHHDKESTLNLLSQNSHLFASDDYSTILQWATTTH